MAGGQQRKKPSAAHTPVVWAQPPCQRDDMERWRVEYLPEATLVRVQLGDVQPESIDVFVDERGVFITAARRGQTALRIVTPIPGADASAAPQAQLRQGELIVLLPRPDAGQQRVPLAVRSEAAPKGGAAEEEAA